MFLSRDRRRLKGPRFPFQLAGQQALQALTVLGVRDTKKWGGEKSGSCPQVVHILMAEASYEQNAYTVGGRASGAGQFPAVEELSSVPSLLAWAQHSLAQPPSFRGCGASLSPSTNRWPGRAEEAGPRRPRPASGPSRRKLFPGSEPGGYLRPPPPTPAPAPPLPRRLAVPSARFGRVALPHLGGGLRRFQRRPSEVHKAQGAPASQTWGAPGKPKGRHAAGAATRRTSPAEDEEGRRGQVGQRWKREMRSALGPT
ncbi:uncharacterized protein ACOB8E_017785 [Sarcophilus harrisii]